MSKAAWVITGVSSGLGYALALHVASQGDKVVGTVRSLAKFPEQLKAAGVLPLVLDLDQPDEDVRKAGETALRMLGTVDVLVNNAGCTIIGPVEEQTLSNFRAVFQTNFFGLLAFTQPFITHFRTRRTGHILNVSSIAGSVTLPAWGPYCATKAALDSLTNMLSSELKLFGVRVLDIMPGVFPSEIWAKGAGEIATNGNGVGSVDSRQLSTIYTDPDTQGYDTARRMPKVARETGQLGDPEKYAQRVYEVVMGVGLAREAVARPAAGGKWVGPWELNRVPLGTDCFSWMGEQLGILENNFRVFESIARSTDVDEEHL